jgi:hypothetical protein
MSSANISLVDLYGQCVSAFQHILSDAHLLGPSDTEDHHEPLDTLLEQHGRFKVWSEQTRIYLPSGSRGSLDELVRDHPKTKRILASTLTKLVQLLERGWFLPDLKVYS